MIRRRVSAVCLLRDGFTGRPMAPGSLRCELDGRPLRPLWKPEGYLVLADLEPGEHRLSLRGRGFLGETVTLSVRPGEMAEEALALRPGPGYPFPAGAVRAALTLSAGNRPMAESEVWMAAPAPVQLRLAQARAEAGAGELRLFCRGPAALLPVPGPFLIPDGERSELVRLRALWGERGRLAQPLAWDHARGSCLLPALRFQTGPGGSISAVFPSPGTCFLLTGKGLGTLELKEGENFLSLEL